VLKAPRNLVYELGIRHDCINPGAQVQRLEKKFPLEACTRINARRKLGMSVMFEIVAEAKQRVETYGKFEWLIDEASHFGYGGIYARLLADQGLIAQIANTAGRGNEVKPFGGLFPRMGTNPISFALPTKQQIGFHLCADFAWSMVSMGKKAQIERQGGALPVGAADDRAGELTTNPKAAAALLYADHKAFAQALYIESIASLMGGGLPTARGLRQGDTPGGGADWIVTVASPEYFACKQGDAMQRLVDCLTFIVNNNGKSRLPGAGYAEKAKELQNNAGCLEFLPAEMSVIEELAMQAGESL
jgi:L-2-hydroxycarboxylate dehydrogenase (NAD+)